MEIELEPTLTTATELPDVLCVIDGVLDLETYEDATAYHMFAGLKYYLSLEFARQQPALSLLYDLNIQFLGLRRGSRHIDFKIWVRLKKHVKGALGAVGAEIQKAGIIACLGVVLAIPGAINETAKWSHLREPVQQRLQQDMPHCSPIVTFVDTRVPDTRDTLSAEFKEFEL